MHNSLITLYYKDKQKGPTWGPCLSDDKYILLFDELGSHARLTTNHSLYDLHSRSQFGYVQRGYQHGLHFTHFLRLNQCPGRTIDIQPDRTIQITVQHQVHAAVSNRGISRK